MTYYEAKNPADVLDKSSYLALRNLRNTEGGNWGFGFQSSRVDRSVVLHRRLLLREMEESLTVWDK